MESAEYHAFRKQFGTLCGVIDNPMAVATEAYTRDMVSIDVVNSMHLPTKTTKEKANYLLCCMASRISTCPESFHEFVRVLKTQKNLIAVAENLQMEYCELKFDLVLSVFIFEFVLSFHISPIFLHYIVVQLLHEAV